MNLVRVLKRLFAGSRSKFSPEWPHATKENLFVSLADGNYLEQAKQLFSSVYHNAGWNGDYLLLAHDVPDSKLDWFRSKGILVKHCRPLFDQGQLGNYHVSLSSKLYLFMPYIKQWKQVIYVDGDATVTASLDELLKVKAFAAVKTPIRGCFHKYDLVKKRDALDLWEKIKREYSLTLEHPDINEYGFNAGMMAFNTKFVQDHFVNSFLELAKRLEPINRSGDQAPFNLMFRDSLEPLAPVYNANPSWIGRYNFEPEEFDGIILHYTRFKPWSDDFLDKQPSAERFSKIYADNREAAELMDLTKPPPPANVWEAKRITEYSNNIRKYLLR